MNPSSNYKSATKTEESFRAKTIGLAAGNVRYVHDGVLYNAITRVREEQTISVTSFEEPNREFEIAE